MRQRQEQLLKFVSLLMAYFLHFLLKVQVDVLLVPILVHLANLVPPRFILLFLRSMDSMM